MKKLSITLLASAALLVFYSPSIQADALDDLLQQLEHAESKAELKPEAKTTPSEKAPKSAKKATPSKPRTKVTPAPRSQPKEPITQPTAKARSAAPFKSTNKREQHIMSFFKTKITPIANDLYKLVESKETQQLMDASKKKRAEREKAAASKAGRGTAGRGRGTSVGGGGRGGYGGGGYGGHGGGWGGKDWSPGASSSSSWGTHPSTFGQEPSKLTPSTTTPGTTTKGTEDTGRRSSVATERDEFEKDRSQIKRYTEKINNLLTTRTNNIEAAKNDPEKQAALFEELEQKEAGTLKKLFEDREECLSSLPTQEQNAKRAEIKSSAEKALWVKLFTSSDDHAASLKAKALTGGAAIKHELDPVLKNAIESFFDITEPTK